MFAIRRIASFIYAFLVFFIITGANVYAAETAEADDAGFSETETVTDSAGDFIVETDQAGSYKYEDGRLYIYGGTVSVKNSPDKETTNDRIEISGNAQVVLAGVSIEAVDGAAVTVMPGADAEIRLEGEKTESDDEEDYAQGEDTGTVIENYLCGADGYAGIEAGTLPGGNEMPVLSSNVRITGEGYLTAAGGTGGAGIGGSRGQYACGIISIESGHVTAVAGALADGIGCGAESQTLIKYLPYISENVRYLLAVADGNGTAIACKTEESEENTPESGDAQINSEETDQALILRGTFASTQDGSLSGLKGISVKATTGEDETEFDMPSGYRSFAVKTAYSSDYMIEQGGQIFAASDEENYAEGLTQNDECSILFVPQKKASQDQIYLVPVQNVPAINIDVISEWDDEDDKDGSRPDNVVVTLYANGNETGRTITLSEENDWQGTFDSLALYSDSVKQSYSVVEENVSGYMETISGSDQDGYTITNIHKPMPEGRRSDEEIANRPKEPVKKGTIVATVVTTKVSRSMPVRTSTTIKKTQSAKTADTSDSIVWGTMLLMAVGALFVWMHFEQKRD